MGSIYYRMERLIQFLKNYTSLSTATIDFLSTKGYITQQPKGAVLLKPNQIKMNWYLLLDGLVGYKMEQENGTEILQKICTPYHYFVGTKHLYSVKPNKYKLVVLQQAEIYRIQHVDLQHGIKQYPEINLLYHILKQRNLDASNHLIHIQRMDRQERLHYLYKHFPTVQNNLTIRSLCSLLGFTNLRQYYKALAYHYAVK